jgi:hypothetical protein
LNSVDQEGRGSAKSRWAGAELRRHAVAGTGAGTVLMVIMTVLTPVSIIGREPCPLLHPCPSLPSPNVWAQ